MGAASIILPQRLSEKLREKAKETDSLPEELGVELILKGLNEELDPEGLVEHYQSLSEKYLDDARELLKEGGFGAGVGEVLGCNCINNKNVGSKERFEVGGAW